MSRPTILLVEDELDMRKVLAVAFQSRGYEVVEAASGAQALAALRDALPSVVILDLGLPDMDGVDIVLDVRREHGIPIIVLSARGEEYQQIKALDAGANDYVTKPFREGELMARVRAALRYSRGTRESPELHVGNIVLDTVKRRVFVSRVEVELTPIEFKLLHLLAMEAGRVVTHGQLLSEVWGPSRVEEVQYLRTYMRQLRAKIEEDPSRPKRIMTELGVGYRLTH
jgi:two-component system KDP operon response regulator KdpE